jgi:26S proteasome regulatory subunit N3
METDDASAPSPRLRGAKSSLTPLLPEVDVYLHLLVLLHLLQEPDAAKNASVECADALVKKVVGQNRRSLDLIAARCYYYFMRSYEARGEIAKVRGFLHGRLRTATLRNDCEGQAVLINCLLRSYVNHSLYDQVEKTFFPLISRRQFLIVFLSRPTSS